MAGVLGIDPMPFTFKQLVIMYDARVLHDWDQTHLLATHLANIPIYVSNMFSKRRQRPTTFLESHHLRKSKGQGLKLTPQNLHLLKGIADDGSKVQRRNPEAAIRHTQDF